jgi:hypothetical protein
MPDDIHDAKVTDQKPMFYHRPEWDETFFVTEFGGDTMKKLGWSVLHDRCHAELASILEYVMWFLGTRHGGVFDFSTSALDWEFHKGRFEYIFGFMVDVERHGQEVVSFGATALIKGRMKWNFGLDMGDPYDLEFVGDFDFTAPEDLNRLTREIARCVALKMQSVTV